MSAENPARPESSISLDDKYTQAAGWVFMTGNQALVRLPIQQRLRDMAEGRNTAGYISGYRGSPVGRLDMELWRVDALLKKHHIFFRPGINEDLAATAVWGSQYVGDQPAARYDGVFGIWYGKGPGVDRSGDAFKHANYAGSSAWGGVLAIAGDDHGCKSSTVPNFSDPIFVACGMPLLYPSNTQELLDYGLHGIAMSRFSGCWVGMKVVTDVVEGGGTVCLDPAAPLIVKPEFNAPPGGLHARPLEHGLAQEARLYQYKLPAALAYCRANQLNRITIDPAGARIGMLAAGKAYQDLLAALSLLGIDEPRAHHLGLRVAKAGMIWPLDPVFVAQLAKGLDLLLVVEEKRPMLEEQVKAALYDSAERPRIVGKYEGANVWAPAPGPQALSMAGELAPPQLAGLIARLVKQCRPETDLVLPAAAPSCAAGPVRAPGFCSGCPHNRSTQVIAGSRAMAGIGCHTMAVLVDPVRTHSISHMGGEGVMWLGQQPFTDEAHVFANMGDGTFFHSGFLAIRQAIAAQLPITYKLLVNGVVAMTGGQPIEGSLSVRQMVDVLLAEGVGKLILVTDDITDYPPGTLPPTVPVRDRSEFEAVQQECRAYPGVSVIIYQQPCATERRRLRKRSLASDPAKRSFINAAVCEGCGDCSRASGCMSIEPLETDLGRKRRINQDSCNKDFSCVDGFCPSFVTVHGGRLRKPALTAQRALPPLTAPALPVLSGNYGIVIAGIGGTGVVTLGQILGMAAHLDGLHVSVLDVTGLAQKYGAVLSHVVLAATQADLHATRIAAASASLVLGCDLVACAGDEVMSKLRAGHSSAVVNTGLTPTVEFIRNPDWAFDRNALEARLRGVLGERLTLLDAQAQATALLGEPMAANMFLLGLAWQQGLVPLSEAAIDRAIELNGVQVANSRASFAWGRAAVCAPEALSPPLPQAQVLAQDLAAIVERRAAFLTAYQDQAYAQRFRHLVDQVAQAEDRLQPGGANPLARQVAESYFKLLAFKDGFEVARLYASAEFRAELARNFEGDYRLQFHIGMWPFARRVAGSDQAAKGEVGPWLMTAFALMARLRGLRHTRLDPFRYSAESRLNRDLLADFEADVPRLLDGLNEDRWAASLKLAGWPQKVRGFGHVRAASAVQAGLERAAQWQLLG